MNHLLLRQLRVNLSRSRHKICALTSSLLVLLIFWINVDWICYVTFPFGREFLNQAFPKEILFTQSPNNRCSSFSEVFKQSTVHNSTIQTYIIKVQVKGLACLGSFGHTINTYYLRSIMLYCHQLVTSFVAGRISECMTAIGWGHAPEMNECDQWYSIDLPTVVFQMTQLV